MQLKLNEMVAALQGASNRLVNVAQDLEERASRSCTAITADSRRRPRTTATSASHIPGRADKRPGSSSAGGSLRYGEVDLREKGGMDTLVIVFLAVNRRDRRAPGRGRGGGRPWPPGSSGSGWTTSRPDSSGLRTALARFARVVETARTYRTRPWRAPPSGWTRGRPAPRKGQRRGGPGRAGVQDGVGADREGRRAGRPPCPRVSRPFARAAALVEGFRRGRDRVAQQGTAVALGRGRAAARRLAASHHGLTPHPPGLRAINVTSGPRTPGASAGHASNPDRRRPASTYRRRDDRSNQASRVAIRNSAEQVPVKARPAPRLRTGTKTNLFPRRGQEPRHLELERGSGSVR